MQAAAMLHIEVEVKESDAGANQGGSASASPNGTRPSVSFYKDGFRWETCVCVSMR